MSVDRSSDSLSRWDPSSSSSLYDVRKQPAIQQTAESDKKIEGITGSKDTIEVSLSKEHLKQEAINRLRRPAKFMIAQQGFMRIGKYLFLSLTLPPYLLLYGLPKWVVVEALPALFSPLIRVAKALGAKIKKPVQVVQKRWVQFVQAIQQVGMGLIQPVIRLMSDMRQGIRRFQERVNGYFKGFRKKAHVALLLPGVKIKEAMKYLQKRATEWTEKIGRSARALAENIQGGLQTLKEVPVQFLGWGQAQFQRLNEYTVSWKKSWGQRLHRSQRLTERAMGWMAKQSHQIIKKITVPIQPFITFYRQKWKPRWQQFKQMCGRKWKEGNHAFHQKHQKMLQRLQKRQEQLKNLSYMQAMEHLFSGGWFTRLPRLLQEILKKLFFHSFMRGIGSRLIHFYSWMVGHFFALPSRCISVVLRSMQALSKSLQSVKKFLKSGGQTGGRFFMAGQQKGGRWIWFSAYYVLLSFTMGGILFAWGMESAKTITLSLMARISFKSN